jgi:uncharacterized repeat protein (TIGR03803 family)
MLRFGSLIGLCALAIAAPLTTASAKVKFKVLHAFTGADGQDPWAGLIVDGAGNLYGTTVLGGATDHGTVFRLAPDGTETVLYSFKGGEDGAFPEAGLIADGDSNLYGTTNQGGVGSCIDGDGCGTVFRLAPDGTHTALYSFTGGDDGALPDATLIADGAGNLYGTTALGGIGNGKWKKGTVFKLAPDGTETVLHAFKGGTDGKYPGNAGLIADSEGNLYGTTARGGKNKSGSNSGTVFKLAPDGTETVLYRFKGGKDGALPSGGLITDGIGNLYGTTEFGGKYHSGTVFRLAPDGKEAVLYSFTGGTDGAFPETGVIVDVDGNLYGTTLEGGASGRGTVFRLAPNGKETVLHSFTDIPDGEYPGAGLIADGAGNLYGTAALQDDGYGTVFEITGAGAVPPAPK